MYISLKARGSDARIASSAGTMDVAVWFGRLVGFTNLSEKCAVSIFKVTWSTKGKGVTITSCFFPVQCVSSCHFEKFGRIINCKPTSQKAHFVSVTKINKLMTLKDIMCFCKDHTKHMP
jgi:hypothetical protein